MSDDIRTDIGPFAIVPDWIVRAHVSDRAIRLFAVLARYADRDGRAFPNRATQAGIMCCSVDSVDRAARELVRVGALSIEPRFDAAGDRTSSLYRLKFAEPGVAAPVWSPGRNPAATGDRTSAATVAAPVRHRTIPSGAKPKGSNDQTAVDQFESRFWPAYPRHVAKKEALRAFLKLRPDRDLLERMLAALQRRWPTKPKDLKFIPHPATWLNGERWLDDLDGGCNRGRIGAPAAGKYAGISEPGLERAS
jgi:hypothetical protein